MHKQKQTGWPVIGILALLFAGTFAGGFLVSGESLEQFYRDWVILTWIAGAFIVLCVLAELSCLKCPHCRSRAIVLLSAEEVDRWIGQKIVTENTISIGAFQTFGNSKIKGMTEGIAVGRRTIPVTKSCILEKHRCQICEREFERRVTEEMR
jgi:hypothetical protein